MNYPSHRYSMEVEISEALYDSIRTYLEARPDWDQERVFTAALSLFLLQGRGEQSDDLIQRQCSRIYLDAMFKKWAIAPVTSEEGNAIWNDLECDRHGL